MQGAVNDYFYATRFYVSRGVKNRGDPAEK